MGNSFEFTAITDSRELSVYAVEAGIKEVRRIEEFLSTYKNESKVNEINNYAGIKEVKVDNELFALIARCQKISHMTQGAFDISYGGVDKSLWNFDTKMKKLPSPATAKASIKLVNYRNIQLDCENLTVKLLVKGMRIGFGGIGKGYAADAAKKVMQAAGAKSGVINAAGDMNVWGSQSDGKMWSIGIAHPDNKFQYFSKLTMHNGAVATSGDYEKYVMINNKRYSHTIDPRTGLPCQGIKSATVICPIAELADALTTPLIVMGVQSGINLINQINDVECIVVDDKNCIHYSKNISKVIK
jgi:thiamine biosynthesis lipoprotein